MAESFELVFARLSGLLKAHADEYSVAGDTKAIHDCAGEVLEQKLRAAPEAR